MLQTPGDLIHHLAAMPNTTALVSLERSPAALIAIATSSIKGDVCTNRETPNNTLLTLQSGVLFRGEATKENFGFAHAEVAGALVPKNGRRHIAAHPAQLRLLEEIGVVTLPQS